MASLWLVEVIKLIGETFEPKNTLCHSFRIIVIPSFLIIVIPSVLMSFILNIVIPSELLPFQIFVILNSSGTPRTATEMDGTLHTDLWKSETSRDKIEMATYTSKLKWAWKA